MVVLVTEYMPSSRYLLLKRIFNCPDCGWETKFMHSFDLTCAGCKNTLPMVDAYMVSAGTRLKYHVNS